ncbi:unnamed protein product [Aureobasidium pullulans]|nr:unnamed protein product [Aureobasidium pullulans]
MPDQTIKEHFDTIATALDAATTRAAGYSKTIQTCMNQDKRLKSAYKRYRTEKAQLGAESQSLRAQNDRLTEIISVLYQGITPGLEGTTNNHSAAKSSNTDDSALHMLKACNQRPKSTCHRSNSQIQEREPKTQPPSNQVSYESLTAHIANFEKENRALKIENQKFMISIDELKECIRAKDTEIQDLQEQLSSQLVVGGQGVKTVTQMEGAEKIFLTLKAKHV